MIHQEPIQWSTPDQKRVIFTLTYNACLILRILASKPWIWSSQWKADSDINFEMNSSLWKSTVYKLISSIQMRSKSLLSYMYLIPIGIRSILDICSFLSPFTDLLVVAPRTSLERLLSNWIQLCNAPTIRQKSLIYSCLFKFILYY